MHVSYHTCPRVIIIDTIRDLLRALSRVLTKLLRRDRMRVRFTKRILMRSQLTRTNLRNSLIRNNNIMTTNRRSLLNQNRRLLTANLTKRTSPTSNKFNCKRRGLYCSPMNYIYYASHPVISVSYPCNSIVIHRQIPNDSLRINNSSIFIHRANRNTPTLFIRNLKNGSSG